jgi:adenylate cyclase
MSNSTPPHQPRKGRPAREGQEILDWDIPFYEGILLRDPDHVDALHVLGHLYTEKGQVKKGLEVDLKLSALCPTDEIVRFNLACSYALVGRKEQALETLEHAVQLGFDDAEKILTDPDLKSLHDEPRFKTLLDSLESPDVSEGPQA